MTSEKKRQSSDKPMFREWQAVRPEREPEEQNYLLDDIQIIDEEEDDYW